MARVLIIPDTQAPFQHRDALLFLVAVNENFGCEQAVHIGDEFDFYALSAYEKTPEAMGFPEEFKRAMVFMNGLYKEFPNTKVCVSNHTWRPYRTAKAVGIHSMFMQKISEVAKAPKGWQWAERWEIDGVLYEHGHELKGSTSTLHRNAYLDRQQSVVFGHHHHIFGTQWHRAKSLKYHRYFTMGVGCLINEKAYAFQYEQGPKGVQLGCGVVLNQRPVCVPMKLTKSGRWDVTQKFF